VLKNSIFAKNQCNINLKTFYMKKLNFTLILSFVCVFSFAQVTTHLSVNNAPKKTNSNQTKAMAMSQFDCNSNYVPSTNGIVLNFYLDFSSPDAEYADYIKLEFPAGFTTVSATAIGTTNPNTVGQDTATWGSTPGGGSGWGDINSSNGPFNFSVTVDVGAITGQQTISYSIIGDGYGATPHSLSGTITVNEAIAADVKAESIDVDNIVYGAFAPQATAFNNGSATQSFDFIMQINPGGYIDTVSINNLAAAASQQESFASFTPTTQGVHSVTIYTDLSGDGNTANDTLEGSFYYLDANPVKAYAWNAYSPSTVVSAGPVSLMTDAGALTSIIADTNTVFAGTWMDSIWVVINNNNQEMFKVDTTSGALTLLTTVTGMSGGPTGIAYDYTTSTLFGIVYNDPNSELYSIDVTTGTATLIGSNPGLAINLACDHNGDLFTVDLLGDSTYAVNKSTAAWTGIGPVGIDLNYAQDMEYDHNNNVCYMAAYGSQGELRILDLTTGESFLVEAFTDGCEVTALAIPKYGTPSSINNANEDNTFNIYPNPSQGVFTITKTEEAEIFVYDILGNLVFTETIDSQAKIDLSQLSNGNYILKLVENNQVFTKQISIIK
jgi:hypothetical protein